LALAAMLLAASAPVYAQTPTPEPWPTPIVTTEYIIRQEVTYGEGGIIVMLFFMAGVLLLQVLLHLGERVTDR
jgi:hypothetical protein